MAKVVLALMVFLLTACSNNGYVYDTSVDVQPSGWAPTDTLVFPVHVCVKANPAQLVERYIPYCVGLSMRYESFFPCGTIMLHVCLDNGPVSDLVLDLGSLEDMPDGRTFGSLCVKQFDEVNLCYSFPDSGVYNLKIWPDTLTEHILSVTTTLE